jgi:hypothetical protein
MSPVIRFGLDLFRLAMKFALLWNEIYIIAKLLDHFIPPIIPILISPFFFIFDLFQLFQIYCRTSLFDSSTRPQTTPPLCSYPYRFH